MREIPPDQWLEIFTRPDMSEAELEEYKTLFENDELFLAYVHAMHLQGALDAFRQASLTFFQHGYPAEAGIIAAVYLWLYLTRELYPEFDQSLFDHWLRQAMPFCQILLAFAVDAAMTLYRSEPEREISEYPREWEEMYAQWSEHLYAASRYGIEPEVQLLTESSEKMIETWLSLFEQFQTEAGLRLDTRAYHKMATHLLLQTFIFAYVDPLSYYQIAACFDEIYLSLGFDLPTLLILLRGNEHLLQPENQEQLMQFLAA